MTALSIIWTLILLDLATLHAAWAARIWWPLGDETALARAVVGTSGISQMPGPLPCGFVATLLVLLALLPWWDPIGFSDAALRAAALVLLLRGLASCPPAWADRTPEMPFRRLDQIAYGPLCLLLSLLALTIGTRP
ncbi:MAG: DUF3995 domain-containing protein [Pseudomonadota bacterium]